MRITRLVAGAVTAGLLGVTPIAISAPADAAVTVQTAATITSSKTAYVYGDTIFFDAAVTTTDPDRQYAPGSATLYMMRGGSSTWEAVATDDGVSYLYFSGVKAVANAQYKVVYPGGTDTYDGDVYTPSESAPFAIATARKLTIKNPRGTFIKGKVAPKYKKKPVIIQKKVGKKWKKFRKIKTNKQSRFSITLPASRKRTYFKIMVKGNREFATASQVGSTVRYRPTTGRLVIK